MNKKSCHCEPVTDVTGVAIPRIDEKTLKIREIPTPVVNRLGMTVLLFVQYYFCETAPSMLLPDPEEGTGGFFIEQQR